MHLVLFQIVNRHKLFKQCLKSDFHMHIPVFSNIQREKNTGISENLNSVVHIL